jgi:hypothetical protein
MFFGRGLGAGFGRGILGLGLVLGLGSSLDAQSTRALIVTGVSGEPRLAAQFERDGAAIRDAVVKRFGGAAVLLTERSTPKSDKTSFIAALKSLSAASKAGDQILIVLIGHGSAQGGDARFNIPGPDITADELGRALESLQGNVAVVVATSASGAFISPLNGAGRVIITATKSGGQNEEVVFASHFAKALSDDVADINKDARVSLAEAFEYSKREVARFYEQNNRIATETATLTGTGAESFVLRAASRKAADPGLTKLYAERQQIEQQIAALKARKLGTPDDVYNAEMEKLLVQLARLERQIRAQERN